MKTRTKTYECGPASLALIHRHYPSKTRARPLTQREGWRRFREAERTLHRVLELRARLGIYGERA